MKKIVITIAAVATLAGLGACGLEPAKPGVIQVSEYDPAGFEWKKKSNGKYGFVWESAETELTLTDGREYDLSGNRAECVPGKTYTPATGKCGS